MPGESPDGKPESLRDGARGNPTSQPAQASMTARSAALGILSEVRKGARTARNAIDAFGTRHDLTPRDLALITELVMGVVRHRMTLSRILGISAQGGWQRINRRLRDVLLLGAYQLVWLDGIPPFAAVNETVEQAKLQGGPRAGRFVNAVLRQLLRDMEQRRIPTSEADATRAIPIDRKVSCQFRKAVLPDPAEHPIEHLAIATSNPAPLVAGWVKAFGMEKTQEACRAGMQRPPTCIRPNRLRTDAGGLIDRLGLERIDGRPSPCGRVVVVEHAGPLIESKAFADGWFQPQDPTAMRAVEQMDLSPGQVVLDLCAGLGTKATQMAELMNNTGMVLASDKDAKKLDALRANCLRMGYQIVKTVPACELEAALATVKQLDWILVDAPCSNTGVLARRPEARYRVLPRAVQKLSAQQVELLARAGRLAGKQTRLVYSTCSIEPAENGVVAESFARSHPEWHRLAEQQVLPSAGRTPSEWRDGGYWAVFVRQ